MDDSPHEPDIETEPVSFQSADEYAPLLFAPPDYRPRMVCGPVVYADEIPDLPPRPGWDRDFDGGSSSSLIFLRADGCGQLVRVSKLNPFHIQWEITLFEQFDLEPLWYSDPIENAYDAFWLADALISGNKSTEDIEEILQWTLPPPPPSFDRE